ncbi:MAG: protein kinase domain-containing protein [Blastocatellia bacterium]
MRELSLSNCRLDKRYDIIQELGRGSYSEIFVARDILASPQSPHSFVVIKALNVFLQNDLDIDLERTLVENFQNEAIALDRVRHPNIISRLGHGTARDLAGTTFHYLVLEYMQGGDMQRLSREGNLTLKAALRYIEQVCAGLRHAHRHGIIHRDIKPQNLLLTKDRETVKIADFGVARIHQSDSPITRVGTNIYAPPEHSPLSIGAEGVVAATALTPAADIYSLAKSVYTLITSESPRFYANQPVTDLPMTVRNEEWAPELKRLMTKATLNDSRMRHQSVDEFWSDLEGLRRAAEDFETATSVRPKFNTTPQAHVARGYSPLAPQRPKFDTSRDLKLRHPLIPDKKEYEFDRPTVLPQPPIQPMQRVEDYWPQQDIGEKDGRNQLNVLLEDNAVKPKKRRLFLRRAAMLVLLSCLLGGALYGTAVFLRRSGLLPEISGIFNQKTGRANTDINLRPEPNANNEPIGLVTRNSRVRIVKIQNNWYQVDVIEQGRERDPPLTTSRGWLNGRYVDLD